MNSEPGGTATGGERLAMLAACIAGDGTLAYRLATELLDQGVPFDELVAVVLGPMQTDVGTRWAAGDLSVADEHAASAVVDDLLIRLGATAEMPTGPSVVVACAERETHALGSRVVASSLALAGFRVLFLGASVPALALADFLELEQPLALALSCSTSARFVAAARSVAAAHRVGVPVIGGGAALATPRRAARLGFDAFARLPHDAIETLHAWEISAPGRLVDAPAMIPEHAVFVGRRHALVARALEGVTANGDTPGFDVADELDRVLQVVEGALLLHEPDLIKEHRRWLHETGATFGLVRGTIDAVLVTLADAMNDGLPRAERALRNALS